MTTLGAMGACTIALALISWGILAGAASDKNNAHIGCHSSAGWTAVMLGLGLFALVVWGVLPA